MLSLAIFSTVSLACTSMTMRAPMLIRLKEKQRPRLCFPLQLGNITTHQAHKTHEPGQALRQQV